MMYRPTMAKAKQASKKTSAKKAKTSPPEHPGRILFAWVPQPIAGTSVVTNDMQDSILQFRDVDMDPFRGGRQLWGGYVTANAGYIPASRNRIVRDFLSLPDSVADKLLMIDWDITFTPEDVYALVDVLDPIQRPIVSGLYVTWFQGQLRPCWTEEHDDATFAPLSEVEIGALHKLTSPAMGFCLMHRSILERLESPDGPEDPWRWFGHDLFEDHDHPADRHGEDVSFANRVLTAGGTMWGHAGVLLGHTKARTMYPIDMIAENNPRSTGMRFLNLCGADKRLPVPDRYKGWEQVLLDIQDGPGVDVVADARALPDDVGTFDAVYCSHGLEHFDEQDAVTVLEQARGVLKDPGWVEIHVPSGDAIDVLTERVGLDGVAYVSDAGPITPRMMRDGFDTTGPMRHLQVFTNDSLEATLRKAGFTDVVVQSDARNFELVAVAVP